MNLTPTELRDLFLSVIPTQDQRLAEGLARREAMGAAIQRGETVTGPRAEWLTKTTDAVIAFIAEHAQSFNDANPDDLISTLDLCDVMLTGIKWIKDSDK